MSAVELTNWADQVLKKRLENVRGVGSVTLVGGTKREINIYLDPAAMEALGITTDQVVAAVRNENQDLPVGAIRSLAQDRVVQIAARMQRPEDFGRIIVARKNGAAGAACDQVARVADGAQELESLALYNGERTLLLSVQKSQDENTIEVVDGLRKTARRTCSAQLPPGVRLEPITDGSRPIRVSVENVRAHADRGRAADRADRLPVPELLALHRDHRPDAADRADRHLPVHEPVRLHDQHGHADGAVAVRGPADRRRDRGAREHRAPRADGQDALPGRAWTARRRSAWRCWPPPSPSSRCSCRSASWAASSASSSTSSASPSWRRC